MKAGEKGKKQQIKEKPLKLEKSQVCVCVWQGNEEKVSSRKKWSTDSNATDRSNKMRTKK